MHAFTVGLKSITPTHKSVMDKRQMMSKKKKRNPLTFKSKIYNTLLRRGYDTVALNTPLISHKKAVTTATTTALTGGPADGFDRLAPFGQTGARYARKSRNISGAAAIIHRTSTAPPITMTKSFVPFKCALLKYLHFNQARSLVKAPFLASRGNT